MFALRTSFAEDDGDELIALSLAGKNTVTERRGVRVVQYKDIKDLTALIRYGLPEKRPAFLNGVDDSKELGALLKDREKRIAQTEAEKKGNPALDVVDPPDDEDPNEHAIEPPDDGTEDAVIENPSLKITQAEIDAAALIQRTYRRYAQDRPHREERRKKAKENLLFCRCLFTFSTINFSDDYRRVCLWRLPTLLMLVEGLFPVLMGLKAELKKRWNNADNMDEADKALKKIK
jgi:hypothetical protein